MFKNFKLIKKKESKIIIICLVLALVIGFLAGAVGDLFARSFIFDYFLDNRLVQELSDDFYELLTKYQFLSEEGRDEPLEIVIRRPESSALGKIKQIEVGGLLESLEQGTVDFFIKKPDTVGDVLANSYFYSESLGRGFILTNDGWLVTTKQVIKDLSSDYLVADQRGETYSIQQIVIDPLTEVVFCKIEAANLSTLYFDKNKEPQIGQVVLTLDNLGGVKITTIQNNSYRLINRLVDKIMSSEEFDSYILTSEELTGVPLGSAVLDENGRVIGLVVSQNKEKLILPLNNFSSLINQVLKDQKVERVYLGVTYLDLSKIVLDPDFPQKIRNLGKGVLIYGNKSLGQAGVESQSPAAQAGLEIDDVILKVEGEEINNQQNFTQLIQSYKPGEEVELTVWQDGKEEKVRVRLEKLEE